MQKEESLSPWAHESATPIDPSFKQCSKASLLRQAARRFLSESKTERIQRQQSSKHILNMPADKKDLWHERFSTEVKGSKASHMTKHKDKGRHTQKQLPFFVKVRQFDPKHKISLLPEFSIYNTKIVKRPFLVEARNFAKRYGSITKDYSSRYFGTSCEYEISDSMSRVVLQMKNRREARPTLQQQMHKKKKKGGIKRYNLFKMVQCD